MPRGQHIATCAHCLKQWVCGDCIPSICNECYAAGHQGFYLDCPVCLAEMQARQERIDAAKAAAVAAPPVTTPTPPAKRVFGAGVFDD